MKQIKKITALILSVLLMTAALAGCSKFGAEATATPAEDDVVLELAGIPGDTVVFTVDGAEVTAEEYLYWLAQYVSYMDSYAQYMGGDGIDWEQEMSGSSMAEYCKNGAMDVSKLRSIVQTKAEAAGCTYSEDDAAEYQTELDAMIEQLGGQENYKLWLSHIALSENGMNHINQVSYLYSDLQDSMYGEGTEKAPTDEIIDAYIAENDLLSAKHILLLTVDLNNQDAQTGAYASLGDDVIAAKKAQAEDLLAQLRASDDPIALFDTLMNQYSEDSGLSANPDGYEFTAGDMATEFETATRALEFGEISDVVESSYGYHIILRQDPDTEALRSEWIKAQMDAYMEELVTNAVVETKPEFDALDPQTYYTKLLAHQAEIDALLAAKDSDASATDSAAPATTDSAAQK